MSTKKRIRWWSSPRLVLRTILMLDDTPHRIALGAAIGMFVAMTPTVGLQMILVLLIAAVTSPLFDFNRVAALVMVYVSNPVTIVPIYWLNYRVGCLFYPSSLTWDYFERLHAQGWWTVLTAVFVEIGAPLIAGSLITATVAGLLTYPLVRWLIDVVRAEAEDEEGEGENVASPSRSTTSSSRTGAA